ncbi:S-layer homology domain-containing protein [Domibacillus sp. PGB-M46]|uniref:S-layer homology domain-containing protein n=1 Tax=Domibacillus sp. PGB-M46 TaxID=2910255 RepID=UPI001F5989A0|nr:S-layer homology domain-containing protein [Domibacillus sp. PGB-M46]MCI2255270.1 S-layer homology domain-containing protein [Domibacillus sp. PGB-M46]
MKKVPRIIAVAALAGMVLASTNPSAEAADFMPIYAKPTSEFPFTDVPQERMDLVSALYHNKYLNGVSADKFGWDLSIKRVDAAMIAAHGMGFRKEYFPTPISTLTFKDIPERAKSAISYLQYYQVVNGKTETFFGSNDTITRGEAAIILARAYRGVLITPNEPVHHFTDATGRYAEAINKLVATGIVNGITPERFGTNNPIKRGEFAMMVARLSDPALSPPSSYGELPSSQGGLTMTAGKESYKLSSDTSVSVTLVNKADFAYIYSRIYKLEKKQGDKWVSIKYNPYLMFPTDMPGIEADETQKKGFWFGDFKTLITAGEYRVSHTFYPSMNEGEKVSLAAYFTITE